jgi:hypothetical protein
VYNIDCERVGPENQPLQTKIGSCESQSMLLTISILLHTLRVGVARNPCRNKSRNRRTGVLLVTYVDISSCCVNGCRNYHRIGGMLIRINFVFFQFRRFIVIRHSRLLLIMEEWYCAVNAPVAFTSRKYVTNPSEEVRLN